MFDLAWRLLKILLFARYVCVGELFTSDQWSLSTSQAQDVNHSFFTSYLQVCLQNKAGV